MTSALELRDLTAGHHRVAAVRDLSLHVAPGEVVALLGPNGAGKSTTLDTVCGRLPSIAGEVRVFGSPVRSLRDAAKGGVAYVPENRGLFRQMTVDENLRIRARRRRAVDGFYDRFEVLARLRHRQAGLLSGGEQQLLAVVCALSLEARLLLIDEMTMGLSPTVVRDLAEVVREVSDDGMAVLFVEQHVHVALQLCERAYVLSHGECVLQGTGSDLLDRIDDLSASYLTGEPTRRSEETHHQPKQRSLRSRPS
jgi:branched-chain amino acid transport system ATP-binding protein